MSLSMRSFKGKNVVSFVRKGDYAHPGEEEAITIVFANIPPLPNRMILDVGCGLGGTANFLQQKGFGHCTGIDVEAESIQYAKNKYPNVTFQQTDVLDINEVTSKKFDLIYLFNSFYEFPNQLGALQKLNNVAAFDAQLILFEFYDLSNGKSHLIDLKNSSITHPISRKELSVLLKKSDWKLIGFKDISDKYQQWYANLLDGLQKNESAIIDKFGEAAYQSAWKRYNDWYRELKIKNLGGAIVYAEAG